MEAPDEDIKRFDEALKSLGEHYDVVHIFASRHEAELEDGTLFFSKGAGNIFARYGQIKLWIIDEENRPSKD